MSESRENTTGTSVAREDVELAPKRCAPCLIRGTLYKPAGDSPSIIVNIGVATGVQARFYAHFAEYLSMRGHAVLVTDMPYVGTSFPQNVDHRNAAAKRRAIRKAGDSVSFSKTWAPAIDASLYWLHRRYPQATLVHVGHSNGGHLLALATRSRHLVKRALYVSAATPFMEYYPSPESNYESVDAIREHAQRSGFYPASHIGMGDDLPSGMGAEWQKWFRVPNYHAMYHNFECATLQTRILSTWVSDDPSVVRFHLDELTSLLRIGSTHMIDRTLWNLAIADCTRLAIDVDKFGCGEVGHIGAFRPRQREHLWDKIYIPWIEREYVAEEHGSIMHTRGYHRGNYGPSRFRERWERQAKL